MSSKRLKKREIWQRRWKIRGPGSNNEPWGTPAGTIKHISPTYEDLGEG
jgi:hypothetical protein